jgi:sigma-B regulation protein RsbU (phosphoserine phosphatase)
MQTGIMETTLILLQMICVIIVFAYLLTRSRLFTEVLGGHPSVKTQVLLTLIFGIISIYGTVSGVEVLGAIINVRDLGPMVAGLTCGPIVGLGAGLIGAAYRMSLGGFTVISCSLATILSGLFGGLIYLYRGRKFAGIAIALLFAALMEGLHMLLALIICRPFEAALAVATSASFPMILANSAGMFVFAFIITNLQKERATQEERDNLLREMERKQTELRIAAGIQQSFLPDHIAEVPNFEISARNVMAKEVGGDFFDVIPLEFIPLGKGTAGIVIADVSGKGIPAALYMALTRIVIRVNAGWHKNPADVVRDANAIITRDSKAGMFITLFYGVINGSARTLTYANAGHNPPILYSARDRSVRDIPATGIALGLMDDARYEEGEILFSPGDLLVLYTDGITESVNEKEEMFGEERLREVTRRSAALPAGEIIAAILADVSAFTEGAPPFDDISIVIIRAV